MGLQLAPSGRAWLIAHLAGSPHPLGVGHKQCLPSESSCLLQYFRRPPPPKKKHVFRNQSGALGGQATSTGGSGAAATICVVFAVAVQPPQ